MGDAGFRHLLLHTSMFLPAGNNCYLQLSGVPVYDLYTHADASATEKQDQNRTRLVGSRKRKRQPYRDAASSTTSKKRTKFNQS